jgi:Flp pilus assembly protein TadD/mono/diheme cytochrome c family protein
MKRSGVRGSLGLAATLFLVMPARAAAPVTYYQKIAPIIYENCSPCHRPGESGPFSLLTYEDVKRRATLVASVTKSRYMPPWLPQQGYEHFFEERRLTDAQIQTIQEWVSQGTPAGNPADAPKPPKFSGEWQLGKPDLILHAGQPYHLAPDGQEVFWNFILPVPITTSRWVKSIEVRPGNLRVFHHANVIIDRSRSSRRKEVAPGAGFPGMDLAVEEDTFDPDGHFLSWKPGSEPVVEPDGMAWRADPGMDLILNVHMRPDGRPETVSPEIGIYFTGAPQSKFPMLVQLEHDAAIDIPAGDKDFLLTDDIKIPMDLNVLAVYPHAHYLGKLMEGYATLPDGTRKWLIRIPDWDLGWQGVFRYRRPVFLPKGTVVSMRYHYDNSADNVRNPNSPPKEVRGGNRSIDEMGHLWLQVLPTVGGDHRAELEESFMRQRLEKHPDDFIANYDMGDLLLNKGDTAGAIAHFEVACKANPASAVGATELGVALFTASRLPEAEVQFRHALELDAAYTDARFDLASAEAAGGKWEAAAADFRGVLKARPDDAKANEHLGEVLFLWGNSLAEAGNDAGAAARYQEALPFRPSDAELHGRLGVALGRTGRFAEAEKELETSLQLDPTLEPAKAALRAVQERMK